MRICGLIQDSIVDGPGMRFVCFVQGCPHNCPGCHNPESHDPAGGTEMAPEEVAAQMLNNPLTDGLTLSGGEPFAQPEDCLLLARTAHSHALNVWGYTGWTFEHLRDQGTPAQRTLALPWRGSANQRLIDVPASLAAGKAVLRPDE